MQVTQILSFGKLEKLTPEQIRAIKGGNNNNTEDDKRRDRPGGIQTQ